MKILSVALSALVFCLTMSTGTPDAIAEDKCKHETCWGAVGFSENNKKYGFSYWYSNEDGAVERAKKECPTCDIFKTFANSCGMIAVGSNGSWGFAKGANRDEASANALAACTANGGTDCKKRIRACSRK